MGVLTPWPPLPSSFRPPPREGGGPPGEDGGAIVALYCGIKSASETEEEVCVF